MHNRHELPKIIYNRKRKGEGVQSWVELRTTNQHTSALVGGVSMSQKTVTINGVVYNAQTGLPIEQAQTQPIVEKPTFVAHKQSRPSQKLHRTTSKSQTLNRRIVRKTAPIVNATTPAPAAAPVKSPAIAKFAPHPVGAQRAAKRMDFVPSKKPTPTAQILPAKKASPVIMPAAQRAATPVVSMSAKPQPVAAAPKPIATPAQHKAAAPAPAFKPSQMIKQEAIDKALAADAPKETKRQAAKREKMARKQRKGSRAWSVASASLALLLLGGYFTYLNMPSLSVRVAAAQAGVSASYPGYKPDGYNINGFVTYSPGTVTMNFRANGSTQGYTIEQTKKNWDSTAALENYVKPKSGGSYIPHSAHGLTIYTFDGNAAWVNKGVLYTINGDAPLSSEQIRQIAASM